MALNACGYSSWTIAFSPYNFRFSSFTWLSASTPNTKSHIRSKPCNFSALPAFLGNITAAPLSFHARGSTLFILSQRTLAGVEPSGAGQIHGFYHRFGDTIQRIDTGIGEKCSVGNQSGAGTVIFDPVLYPSPKPGVLVRLRIPSVVTFSVRGWLKLSKHSGALLRSQPRLVLLIDPKARNPSRISH